MIGFIGRLFYNYSSHIELLLNDVCLTNLSLISHCCLDLGLSSTTDSCKSESESYITTDGQSASLSRNKAPIWGLRPDFYYCQTVASLLMWGALSDKRTGSVVYNCCWPSSAQSFSGSSPLGLGTIFYCLRFETSVFVASYDSQGSGGGIRPRLHTGKTASLSLSLMSSLRMRVLCYDRRSVGQSILE
jgi:hypothetical protein